MKRVAHFGRPVCLFFRLNCSLNFPVHPDFSVEFREVCPYMIQSESQPILNIMRQFSLSLLNPLKSKALRGGAAAILAGLLGAAPATAQVDLSGYSMTVEEYAVHDAGEVAGMTTYRFYNNMENETDFMSSIFGN